MLCCSPLIDSARPPLTRIVCLGHRKASPGAACQVEDVDAAKDTNDGSTFVNTEGVNPNAPSAASMVGAGVGAGVGAAAMALCWL